MRQVRIVVADDDKEYLHRVLRDGFEKAMRSGELKDFPFPWEIEYFTVDSASMNNRSSNISPKEHLTKRLLERNADFYFIDQLLNLGIEGSDVANQILKERSDIPVHILSQISAAEQLDLRRRFLLSGEPPKTGAPEVWDKPYNMKEFQDFRDFIAMQARKPLKVAINGGGTMGLGLLQQAILSDSVSNVSIYSEHNRVHKIKDLIEYSSSGKVTIATNLDDIAKGADVLFFASTNIDPENESLRTAKYLDRRDFLVHEIGKTNRDARIVKEADFDGYIVVPTNPVSGNCEVIKRAGFDENQIGFPMNIDCSRMDKALKETSAERAQKNPELIERVNELTMGIHGLSRFVIPKDYHELSEEERQWILDSQEKASEMGKLSRLAAAEVGFHSYEPAVRMFQFIEDLYWFRETPACTNCVFYTLPDTGKRTIKGFIGLPSKVSYKAGNARSQYDSEAIEKIGFRNIFAHLIKGAGLARLLERQQAYYEKVLDAHYSGKHK